MYYYDIGGIGGFIGLIFIIFVIIHVIRDNHKVKHSEWDDQVWQEMQKMQAKEEEKRLIKSKILITKEKFDALAEVSTKVAKLINRLCYEKDFLRYYHNTEEHNPYLTNGEDLYLHFQHEPLNDLLWIYDLMGHFHQETDLEDGKQFGCYNFETVEGHYLYIINEVMFLIDSENPYEYTAYQKTVGDPESLQYKYRDLEKSTFKIFANYNPSVKQKDYRICELVHDYNQDYEQLYRILMYDIAKLVAEANGTTTLEESQWLACNLPTRTETINSLEVIISHHKVPLFKGSSQTNWYEDDYDDDEDHSDLSATVSYSVMDAPEEECDLDNLSDRDLRRLKAADDNGEHLDSDYISEHMHSIHNKIIEAIREDLELKSGDPHDGMVEVHHPPAYWGWEKVHASYQEMSLADEYEIEYTVDVY